MSDGNASPLKLSIPPIDTRYPSVPDAGSIENSLNINALRDGYFFLLDIISFVSKPSSGNIELYMFVGNTCFS